MNHIESTIQCEAFKIIRMLGKTRPFYETIHAIPNGGKRDAITGARMKREGVLAGVWDIFCPVAYLYIEVKKPDGKLTESQAKFGIAVAENGHNLAVCRSVFEIMDALHAHEVNYGTYERHQSALAECRAVLKMKD